MKNRFLIYFGISILMFSCDCWVHLNGKIISSETGEPINGAKIELVDRNLNATSDLQGIFSIGEATGRCYSPKLKVTYKGYKPFLIELESDSDSQNYKLKKEKEFVDYEKPFYPNPKNKNTLIIGAWVDKYSKNFEIKSDSLIIYLDEINLMKEIELSKQL